MRSTLPFVLLVLLAESTEAHSRLHKRAAEKCYGPLGCFRTDGPFFHFPNRPLNLFPSSRESVNTEFYLYTRKNPTKHQQLRSDDSQSMKNSNFGASRPSKYVVHGFTENSGTPWVKEMTSELLKHGDYNVVAVSWQGGAGFPYTQATANTRLVAAELVLFLKNLQTVTGTDISQTHIIGHSLGAHIGGYVGEKLKIKRISGLDPAEPYFQGVDPVVRLDPTDAEFVDVIHSDAESVFSGGLRGGWGMRDPVGHLDFYPNGGIEQPGCKSGVLKEIATEGLYGGGRKFIACDHLRACDFYTESINSNCGFYSVPCASTEDYEAGKCTSCGSNGCPSMGFNSDKFSLRTPLQKFFLKTGADQPFCGFQYGVQLSIKSDNSKLVKGKAFLKLAGVTGSTSMQQLSKTSFEIEAGKSYGFLFLSPVKLGDVRSLTFEWKHEPTWYKFWNWGIFRTPTVSLDKIEVTSIPSNKKVAFCNNIAVGDDIAVTLGTEC